ncbi:MAG: class I SAM-dependent methyltransferase [Deltaproteobacteria bacterium]|nr:class I SAM-dependent methyltransferase [Deltaproteobacteria bacterium]
MPAPCAICHNERGNDIVVSREMKMGTGERFRYSLCAACGSLDLVDVPEDLGRYYPEGYYAYAFSPSPAKAALRRFFDRMRLKNHFGGFGLGSVLNRVSKPLEYLEWLDTAGLGPDARVLDIGCGSGELLHHMSWGGFPRCVGADPFVPQSARTAGGKNLLFAPMDVAAYAATSPEPFDLVMFHHSFEHMEDPDQVLSAASSLLAPGGTILISIPLADSHAFYTYRGNWRGMDAPGHLHIQTQKALGILADRHGLTIYASSRVPSWRGVVISRMYEKNIPDCKARPIEEMFSPEELALMKQEAEAADARGESDAGYFYLRRK